jgi:hypothetical protein
MKLEELITKLEQIEQQAALRTGDLRSAST